MQRIFIMTLPLTEQTLPAVVSSGCDAYYYYIVAAYSTQIQAVPVLMVIIAGASLFLCRRNPGSVPLVLFSQLFPLFHQIPTCPDLFSEYA